MYVCVYMYIYVSACVCAMTNLIKKLRGTFIMEAVKIDRSPSFTTH